MIESNFRKAFLPHCEICPIAQLKDFKISNTFLTNLLTILDSLVVRISACHVEGPGSIPGRGGKFFPHFWHTSIKFNKLDKNVVGS